MNFEVVPTRMEAIESLTSCYVDGVVVSPIDFSERLDKINGVAFVAAKLGANGMRIDGDPQSGSPFI